MAAFDRDKAQIPACTSRRLDTRRRTGPACATTSTSPTSPPSTSRCCAASTPARRAGCSIAAPAAGTRSARCSRPCGWKRASNSGIRDGPRRPGDPSVLVADATRLRAAVGRTPRDDLRAIVRSALAWESPHTRGSGRCLSPRAGRSTRQDSTRACAARRGAGPDRRVGRLLRATPAEGPGTLAPHRVPAGIGRKSERARASGERAVKAKWRKTWSNPITWLCRRSTGG